MAPHQALLCTHWCICIPVGALQMHLGPQCWWSVSMQKILLSVDTASILSIVLLSIVMSWCGTWAMVHCFPNSRQQRVFLRPTATLGTITRWHALLSTNCWRYVPRSSVHLLSGGN